MWYHKFDDMMRREAFALAREDQAKRGKEIDKALVEFLAARRAAKPRIRYIERMRLYKIHGRAFTTYGSSIESAYRSWSTVLQVHDGNLKGFRGEL